MKDIYTFLEGCNSSALRKYRKKRKMSLSKVSEKTRIPFTTLKRYEDGDTKKIPKEAIEKLSILYDTDVENFYILKSFPLLNTFSGSILLQLYGLDITNLNLSEKYYKELGTNKEFFKNIQENPENLKTEEYLKFKKVFDIIFETDSLNPIDQEEIEKLLLAVFTILNNKKNLQEKK